MHEDAEFEAACVIGHEFFIYSSFSEIDNFVGGSLLKSISLTVENNINAMLFLVCSEVMLRAEYAIKIFVYDNIKNHA